MSCVLLLEKTPVTPLTARHERCISTPPPLPGEHPGADGQQHRTRGGQWLEMATIPSDGAKKAIDAAIEKVLGVRLPPIAKQLPRVRWQRAGEGGELQPHGASLSAPHFLSGPARSSFDSWQPFAGCLAERAVPAGVCADMGRGRPH